MSIYLSEAVLAWFLLFACVNGAASSGQHTRNWTVASDEIEDTRYVDPDLLRTRGGITSGKKGLFENKNVYVHANLRRFFYDSSNRNPLSGIDATYDLAVVCKGRSSDIERELRDYEKEYQFFLCPSINAVRVQTYSELLEPGLNADVYCCQEATPNCCDKADFYRWHGTPKYMMTKVIIAVIVIGCLLFLCAVIGGAICCCCIFKCGLEMCKRSGGMRGAGQGGAVYGSPMSGSGQGGAVYNSPMSGTGHGGAVYNSPRY